MIVGEGNAHGVAGTLALEVRHLRHCFDHCVGARLVFRQLKPYRERILPSRLCYFVEESFGRKLVVAGADAAPGMHAHAAILPHIFGKRVRNCVERLIEAACADIVLAAGRLETWRSRDCIDVLRHQAMMPADNIALGVETCLEQMVRHRPWTRGGEILLTRKDQLHRLLCDVGEDGGLNSGIGPDAPAVTATQELLVNPDLIRRGLQDARDDESRQRAELRARPDVG